LVTDLVNAQNEPSRGIASRNFVTHNPPAITLWPEISSNTICIEKDQAEVYADTARRRAFHRATKVGG
jgi:hypothetical protein